MLQCIISLALSIILAECGICSSSSVQTPSAELTVQTAFFSACFFCTLSPHAARYHFHLHLSVLQADVAASLEVQQQWETSVDAAEKDWRLFDNWDRRFDKLPVISAKLSLRVMGANVAGKARCFSDF
ncbi:hypothetical protein ACFX1Q_045920 [Malus domestica]